jgi:cell wall-associated NlpC family hydrolase
VESLPPETRSKIVEAARDEVRARTRWIHQARTPGAALDCGGLVVASVRAAGLEMYDEPAYSRHPWPAKMEAALERTFHRLDSLDDAEPGSVLWLWVSRPRLPQHLAIWTGEGTIIHSWADYRYVLESPWDPYWQQRLHSVWDYGDARSWRNR